MNEATLTDEQVKSLFFVTSAGYRFSINNDGKLLVRALFDDAPIDDHVRAIIKRFSAEFKELTRIGGFQHSDQVHQKD
jgi:hypothetical protein